MTATAELTRPRGRRTLAVLIAAALALVFLPARPASAGIANPGTATLFLVGGEIIINNGAAEFDLTPCDPETDPECEPGPPITLTGTFNANSTYSVPANQVFFPSVELDDPEVQIGMAATSAVNGILDPHTGLVTAGVNLQIYVAPIGVGALCTITLPMALSTNDVGGVPYDQSSGTSTGTNSTFAIGSAVSGGGLVGAIACPQVSSGLGLPSPAGGNFAALSFLADPILKGLIADAGEAQNMQPANQPVTLDGTGSVDAEGEAITFSWEQIAGPPVVLDDASSATPSFMPAGELTSYAFELNVSNESGLTDSALTAVSVYLNVADGNAHGHNVLNRDRCELGLDGVWSRESGVSTCTFFHTEVEVIAVNVNEGTIFINESELPDGPRPSPQYRGNVNVVLQHTVHITYTVSNSTSGQGNPTLDGPWFSNVVSSEAEIVATNVVTTQLTCQRRTLGLFGWSGWSNRALTECSNRATFQFPAVLRGVDFELP
jgi:hypothetical protein